MTKDKTTMRKTAPDPITVDEIFQQLNCSMGARLCHFEFYSRNIQRLQDAYGHEAVAAALHKIYTTIRARATDDIRDLRRNAARLKRESSSAR